MGEEEEFDSESDDATQRLRMFEDIGVYGIQTSVADENAGGGRFAVIIWTAVCVFTFTLQIFISMIMIAFASKDAGCHEVAPTSLEWWSLHLSRFAAVAVAGFLMGKHIMDILTSLLVSEIVEGGHDWQVIAVSFPRFLLSILVNVANVLLVTSVTSPIELWYNVTALGFIGDLDDSIFLIAKHGVLGTRIRKTMA